MDLVGSGVAEVDAAGLLLGDSAGQALVSVYFQDQEADATLTVNVVTLTSLSVSPSSPSIDKNGTQQFTATGSYSDGTTQDLTNTAGWTATDIAPGVGVAAISASGLATGNSGGQATITASYLGQTASTTLTVSRRTASCSPDGWCPLASGTSNQLNGVWASDANNVWAVGSAGTILKWNGTAWNPQTSGTSKQLNGIWGSDASHVWAVGAAGTILTWNGTAWNAFLTGTDNFTGVWGSDANNVWVVGASGTILQWNGTTWTGQVIGDTPGWYYLTGVWTSDASHVFLAGDTGGCGAPYFTCAATFLWNGASWNWQIRDGVPLAGVWGSDVNHAWTVGVLATWAWNGVSWNEVASGTTHDLYGIGGSDGNNVWAVGQSGTILKWNGTGWNSQTSGTGNNLQSVGGSDVNNVWAVGQAGTILQYVP
jgi:hypothetical protein